ncbi:MAG: capsule biosynthesis protein [Paracoccaceae bacterium]|nr:capsule biosynthesis protein [Paracoccaceae bacterium]
MAVLLSFLLMVVLPPVVASWYLWVRAADQYASTVAFSVRTEENVSAITSLLGPLDLSGSSTSDTDILYEFIQSQSLVASIDARLDLRAMWAKADPAIDPIFAYHPPGTIEDLVGHWERMVKIYYDSSTGLIELRALAFTPEDAQAIAREIYADSTVMINELSDIAREDAIRYARDELNHAVERLKSAREAVTTFRNRTQIVDPSIDVQGQAGLLSTLNQQLAEALIELDLLKQTTRSNDPRVAQADRKIQVIEKRIAEEKQKLGLGDGQADVDAFATLVGEFERLVVDREFAEQTYTAALASYDAAQAEARRQSRYLAAHIRPTLAEKSEYPQRLMILGTGTLFLFLIWSVVVLVAYSLRDRR